MPLSGDRSGVRPPGLASRSLCLTRILSIAARKGFKAALIGVGAIALSMAIPLLIIVFLAIVAQLIISGH